MKVLIYGIGGKMGRNVLKAVVSAGHTCIGGVDKYVLSDEIGIPIKSSPFELPIPDVLIDFSVKNALSEILNYALKVKVPVVLCTTGYDSEDIKLIQKASCSIPVFRSGNMSLGVNLLLELTKKTASVIPNADIEITEIHHNQKVDAPSGTAVMIADAVNSALDTPRTVMCGREGMVGKRGNEIGMHSLRGGTVVGKHSVSFFLNGEVITLTHEAESKQVFAEGAVKAAAFMVGKPAGLYNMGDVLN